MNYITVRYHVYVSKRLKPDFEIGGRNVFTQATLDKFLADPPKVGWPKGKPRRRDAEA